MLLRTGTGRVKHLSTKQLWVQAAIEAFPMIIQKVPRTENCADTLTHPLGEKESERQLKSLGFVCVT